MDRVKCTLPRVYQLAAGIRNQKALELLLNHPPNENDQKLICNFLYFLNLASIAPLIATPFPPYMNYPYQFHSV